MENQERIEIKLIKPKKVLLQTKGTYSEKDILINPILQEKTATNVGIIEPDEGYVGLSKVDIDIDIPVEWDGSYSEIGKVLSSWDGSYSEIGNTILPPVDDGVGGIPIEVSSIEQMDALLVAENIGKIYKYVGETNEKYTSGALYQISEEV